VLDQGSSDMDDWLWSLCEKTQLARFLGKNGLDYMLSEGGQNLSVGERQLLSLTRLYVRDPSIVILDEATASLDGETEAILKESLEEFLPGKTSFIVAHRLTTVENADLVLVLDQGWLVEQGTHESLLERDGLSAQFVKQARLHVTSSPRS